MTGEETGTRPLPPDLPPSKRSRLSPRGWLVVIKSTLTHDEPDVIADDKRGSEGFQHESTGDPFFDDAQFEAYRRLGEHMVETALKQSAICRVELK